MKTRLKIDITGLDIEARRRYVEADPALHLDEGTGEVWYETPEPLDREARLKELSADLKAYVIRIVVEDLRANGQIRMAMLKL